MAAILKIDDIILTFIQTNMHSAFLDGIMIAVSWISSGSAVWIAAAILLMLAKQHRTAGSTILGALALSAIIGDLVLKPLIERIRPFYLHEGIELLIAVPTGFSFPSGHTMTSFAAATVLFLHNKRLGISGFALALLIAFSRLYFYVHYPSDIVGGMILGIAAGVVSVKISLMLKKHYSGIR